MTEPDWIALFDDAVRTHSAPDDDGFRTRRNALLAPLQARVRWRGRRRIATRAVAVLVLCVGLGPLAIRWLRPGAPPTPPPVAVEPLPTWIRVAKDADGPPPEMIASLANAPEVRIIGDAELAWLLRESGHAPGVVRTGDRVLLAADFERRGQ